MKKLLGVLAAFGCLLVCCFAFAGCSSDGTAGSEDFIGEWTLESVTAESSDMKVTPSDVALMQSFGYTATLTLNADGTASLDIFGEVTECEWSGKDSVSAVLTVGEEKVDLTLDEEGVLTMSQGGDEAITFVKANEAESQSEQDAAAGDSSENSADSSTQDASSESSASDDATSSADSSENADASGSASTDSDSSSGSSDSGSQSSSADSGEGSSSTTDSAA